MAGNISIHALRKEGDPATSVLMVLTTISIHALRKEGDAVFSALACESSNFYPRPPQGGRLSQVVLAASSSEISIHALRKEGDGNVRAYGRIFTISIHALRKEGDVQQTVPHPPFPHFYPRPPQGGRRRWPGADDL